MNSGPHTYLRAESRVHQISVNMKGDLLTGYWSEEVAAVHWAVLIFPFLSLSSSPPSPPPEISMIPFKFTSGLKFGIQEISSATLEQFIWFPRNTSLVPFKERDRMEKLSARQVTGLLWGHLALKVVVAFFPRKVGFG